MLNNNVTFLYILKRVPYLPAERQVIGHNILQSGNILVISLLSIRG